MDTTQSGGMLIVDMQKRIAELEQENERLTKAMSHFINKARREGIERAAEIVLERYPASQSAVGKELYQAIRAEMEK